MPAWNAAARKAGDACVLLDTLIESATEGFHFDCQVIINLKDGFIQKLYLVDDDVAVEDLMVGDLAMTVSGEHRPIRWIGHRLVEAFDHADPQDFWPVRITAGAIAMGVPSRDLLVSPDHCLMFDDVLVPAKHLINGVTIRQEAVEAVGYWCQRAPKSPQLWAFKIPWPAGSVRIGDQPAV